MRLLLIPRDRWQATLDQLVSDHNELPRLQAITARSKNKTAFERLPNLSGHASGMVKSLDCVSPLQLLQKPQGIGGTWLFRHAVARILSDVSDRPYCNLRSIPLKESTLLNIASRPELIASSAWLAATATVLGEVHIGERSSIWFGAVLRGDVAAIRIGDDTNIQDLACLHADPDKPCTLGNRITMGHQAIVHGATIEDECLIGIGAIVLNDAHIGKHSIIGAGALVTEGKVIPPRSLVLGMPGKIVREVTDEDLERIEHGFRHYVAAAAQYKAAELARS